MLLCLILPMAGNAVIILSGNRLISTVGAYTYYLGMDFAIAGMLHFTMTYCRIKWPSILMRNLVYSLFLVDVIQLLLNPVYHHAFELIPIQVEGFDYYKLQPLAGQTFHRIVDYGILAGIIAILTVKVIRSPRLQTERYSVILISSLLVTAWETAYIFSGTPIDRSMLGFGVFGLLIFYFSLYYRPMRLLDRMLGGVVSEQRDAIYFFDPNQKCLWMNRAGQELLGLKEEETYKAGNELNRKFGNRHPGEECWSDQVILETEDGEHICQLSK